MWNPKFNGQRPRTQNDQPLSGLLDPAIEPCPHQWCQAGIVKIQDPGKLFSLLVSASLFGVPHTEMLMDHVIFIYFYHIPRIGLHEHLQETSPSIQYFMVKEPLVSNISSLFRGSPKDKPVNQHPNDESPMVFSSMVLSRHIVYIYEYVIYTYYIYYIYIYIYIITYNIYIYNNIYIYIYIYIFYIYIYTYIQIIYIYNYIYVCMYIYICICIYIYYALWKSKIALRRIHHVLGQSGNLCRGHLLVPQTVCRWEVHDIHVILAGWINCLWHWFF